MAAGDAFCVHVGAGPSLKAIGMSLQVDVVFLVLLHDQIAQVVLIINNLEDFPIARKDEVSAVIGRDGLRRLLLAPAFDVGAGIC